MIDAAIVRDDRRHVMFLKDETNKPFPAQKNIRVAYSEQAEGPYGRPGEPITGNCWAEGPTAIEIDGKWFVFFDKYRKGAYGLVVSSDLVTWEEQSDRLAVPPDMKHGTVFEAPKKIVQSLLEHNQ